MTDQLLARGMLAAGAPLKGTRRQPSTQLALKPEAAYALGLAISIDGIDVCLVDLGCRVVQQRNLDIGGLHRQAALEAVALLQEQMLVAAGSLSEILCERSHTIKFIPGKDTYDDRQSHTGQTA